MFSYVFITLLVTETVLSQINGEFWWLNEKVGKLQQVEAPPPSFDNVSEFDTDENAKVVFKNNDLNSRERNEQGSPVITGETISTIRFEDLSELSKPTNIETDFYKNKVNTTIKINNENNNIKSFFNKEPYLSENKPESTEDQLTFVFPEKNKILWEDNIKRKNFTTATSISSSDTELNNKSNMVRKPSVIINDKVWFDEETKIQPESESICTFMTKIDCLRNNGISYVTDSCPKKPVPQKVCCILPLSSDESSKVRYPKHNRNFIKRYKRSDSTDELNTALRQRNALLERKFNVHNQESKATATTARTKPTNKIVTPEYVDPYWNVKNSKFRNPNAQNSAYNDYQNTKYDSAGNDYVDDYTVELPKPGLVGLYSDNGNSRGPTSWKNQNRASYYGGEDEVSEEDSGEPDLPFGYSTFDPRLGDRVSTDVPKPIRRKPQRLNMPKSDSDTMKHSESQTINFHSTPDFHVLQGFKLINLVGNKNRFVRKTTTDRFYEDEDTSFYLSASVMSNSNEDNIDGIDLDQQIYKKCGKITKKINSFKLEKDIAENGCDPWLAVVVLTKSPETILCYATIVHPRAVVTAAECVIGKAAGEVTVISGVWDLKEDREELQNRMASVHIHTNYKPSELANDLAILHWKRPLRIDARVQPACLADPHVGDSCYFVGWGGYDQALQTQPRWQRATILTPRICNEKISAPDMDIPAGAFCASVDTRGTMTGIGGPLLCKNSNRISIVGVAVYRENIIVLLPAFEWIVNALRELRIN